MKLLKLLGVLVALAGVGVLALVVARPVYGQSYEPRHFEVRTNDGVTQGLAMLAGRGAEIGVSIHEGKDGGVVIDEVHADSPAEKAGLKRADVIVDFDGERVRSARQFGRLVQETPSGRTVKATITRDGQKKELQIAPSEGRAGDTMRLDMLRGQLDGLNTLRNRLPFDFNYNFDGGALSGRRLGVTVDELTSQLAQYFGAKDGVLVTSVTDGSAASRAGLKAGDVITSIDGKSVRSSEDLIRALRDGKEEELTIGIVRDKKESSVKAKIDAPRRPDARRM